MRTQSISAILLLHYAAVTFIPCAFTSKSISVHENNLILQGYWAKASINQTTLPFSISYCSTGTKFSLVTLV